MCSDHPFRRGMSTEVALASGRDTDVELLSPCRKQEVSLSELRRGQSLLVGGAAWSGP